MKTKDAKEKKFRELSEEELQKVNGGITGIKADEDYDPICFSVHVDRCMSLGLWLNPLNHCECE